jgi:tRNA nucleotidyltransferase (CCA-adding enzyme)
MIKFYQVGGCVRDRLLGKKSKDIDYSVEAPSFEIMKRAVAIRCGANPDDEEDFNRVIKVVKPEFVTIRAIDPKLGGVDFVLCRKDGKYSDGRRPDSIEMGTLADDLARRDFTVNALAEDENGNIIDLFDGQTDLNNRILRCVGGTERLREDSLRMLRAIRFQITKGFWPDKDLESFLMDANNVSLLDTLPIERIRDEIMKCMEFDTLETLHVLNKYHQIRNAIFSRNLRLIPTIFAK